MKILPLLALLASSAPALGQSPGVRIDAPAEMHALSKGLEFALIAGEKGAQPGELRVFVDDDEVTAKAAITEIDVDDDDPAVTYYHLAPGVPLAPGEHLRIAASSGASWFESGTRVVNNTTIGTYANEPDDAFPYTLDVHYRGVEVRSAAVRLSYYGYDLTGYMHVVGPFVLERVFDEATGELVLQNDRYFYKLDPLLSRFSVAYELSVLAFDTNGQATFDTTTTTATGPCVLTDAQRTALDNLVSVICAATPSVSDIKSAAVAFEASVGGSLRSWKGEVNGKSVVVGVDRAADVTGSADVVIAIGSSSPSSGNNRDGGSATATNGQSGGTAVAIGGAGGSGQGSGGGGGNARANSQGTRNQQGTSIAISGGGGHPQASNANGAGGSSGTATTRVQTTGTTSPNPAHAIPGATGTPGMPGTAGGAGFRVDKNGSGRDGHCPDTANV